MNRYVVYNAAGDMIGFVHGKDYWDALKNAKAAYPESVEVQITREDRD